eukprot:16446191-Heterocapsa_arctica.AAC.1
MEIKPAHQLERERVPGEGAMRAHVAVTRGRGEGLREPNSSMFRKVFERSSGILAITIKFLAER